MPTLDHHQVGLRIVTLLATSAPSGKTAAEIRAGLALAGCDRGDPFLAWTLAALSNDGYVAGSGDVYELTAAGRHWATIGGSAPGPAGPFWRLRTKKDVVVSGVEPAVPVHSIRNDGAVLAYYPRVDGDVAALPLTLFADGDYTPEDDDFPGVTYLEVT